MVENEYSKVKVNNEMDYCSVTDMDVKAALEKAFMKARVSYFLRWEKPGFLARLFSGSKTNIVFCINSAQLETAEEVPELRFVKVLSVTDSDGVNVDNTKEPTEDEEPQQSATITVLASPEQARIITEMENDGVAHVALISRNNDQLAEELLAEQDKTLQEIYFPETLVEENAESQDGGEAAEGAADGESTGETGSDGAEGGTETTPADSIPEDGE